MAGQVRRCLSVLIRGFRGGTVYPLYHNCEGRCSLRCFGPRTASIHCCGDQCFRRLCGGWGFVGHTGLQMSTKMIAQCPRDDLVDKHRKHMLLQKTKRQIAPKNKETSLLNDLPTARFPSLRPETNINNLQGHPFVTRLTPKDHCH